MGERRSRRRAAPLALPVAEVGLLLGMATVAEPQISWRVENPFRLFLDPADTNLFRATWLSLTETERGRPVSAAARLLGARHADGWAAGTVAKTCWDRERNRYACQQRGDYINPKGRVVLAKVEGLADDQTVDCLWLTAPQGHGPRGSAIKLPCDTPVELDIPYRNGAWISVEIGGRLVAETAARVADLFVVGIGDSFATRAVLAKFESHRLHQHVGLGAVAPEAR